MGSRRLTKIIILVFTILFADVVKELALHFMHIEKNSTSPFRTVAIGMIIILVVFYPIFSIMDVVMEKMVSGYVRGTKKVAGGSLKGLIIAFVIGFAIIYCVYLYAWFDIVIWKARF